MTHLLRGALRRIDDLGRTAFGPVAAPFGDHYRALGHRPPR